MRILIKFPNVHLGTAVLKSIHKFINAILFTYRPFRASKRYGYLVSVSIQNTSSLKSMLQTVVTKLD